jgi:hypothetical protein
VKNKISSKLDSLAGSLESKGRIKEAYAIDRVTDAVEETMRDRVDDGMSSYADVVKQAHEKVK